MLATIAPGPESSSDVSGTVVAVVVVVVIIITAVIGIIIAVVSLMFYRHKHNSKNLLKYSEYYYYYWYINIHLIESNTNTERTRYDINCKIKNNRSYCVVDAIDAHCYM